MELQDSKHPAGRDDHLKVHLDRSEFIPHLEGEGGTVLLLIVQLLVRPLLLRWDSSLGYRWIWYHGPGKLRHASSNVNKAARFVDGSNVGWSRR